MSEFLVKEKLVNQGTDNEHYRAAVYSDCEKYRYGLIIKWDESKPIMICCCLNPSTATELENDPTIERLSRRAVSRGFGGLHMLNIFAYRATDPKDMKKQEDPIGPLNDKYIKYAIINSNQITIHCGWGNHGLHLGRQDQIKELFKSCGANGIAIKINKNLTPAHPLYQSYKNDFIYSI